jgi:hypothetical protein
MGYIIFGLLVVGLFLIWRNNKARATRYQNDIEAAIAKAKQQSDVH